jgi:hypothetical protein
MEWKPLILSALGFLGTNLKHIHIHFGFMMQVTNRDFYWKALMGNLSGNFIVLSHVDTPKMDL